METYVVRIGNQVWHMQGDVEEAAWSQVKATMPDEQDPRTGDTIWRQQPGPVVLDLLAQEGLADEILDNCLIVVKRAARWGETDGRDHWDIIVRVIDA